jgi:hypothetical protein
MSGSAWGIVWLAIALKIPIVALLYIVWWAIKDPPVPEPHRTRRAAARTAHRSRAHQRAFGLPSARGACPRAIAARPLPAVTFAP